MALTTRQAQRKTWLESALTAIQNAQLGILTAGTTEVSFNGRSVTNLAPQEMERLRRSYESELQKLERIEQGVSSRTIRVIG
jgi:hypothetical protein